MTITDRSIAQRIGVSTTFVNMLRRGHRVPGASVMLTIERVYGWTMQDQAEAVAEGTFAAGFNAAIAEDALAEN